MKGGNSMSTCKVNEHGAIYIEKDVVAKIANNSWEWHPEIKMGL